MGELRALADQRFEQYGGRKSSADIAESVVPPEWYGGDLAVIERLMDQLLKRRSRIRELILSFRNSERAPFPLWTPSATSIAVPPNFMEAAASKDYIM